MRFIDTHTHNYDTMYGDDAEAVIARSVAEGVDVLVQPDIDSKERASMFSLIDRHPGVLYGMLGLYPGSVDKNWRDEIDLLIPWHEQRRDIVAVGEIGLDYHYNKDFAEEQKEAFRIQLELASKWNLPVNIHLREATEDFFDIMDDCRHLGLRGCMHAFSGSYETFLRLQKYGDWLVGIGGVVTFKKASLADVVRQIPLEKIVLETDAPYLTPVPYRGERNESGYIKYVAAKIAELQNTDLETVASVTCSNAEALYGI